MFSQNTSETLVVLARFRERSTVQQVSPSPGYPLLLPIHIRITADFPGMTAMNRFAASAQVLRVWHVRSGDNQAFARALLALFNKSTFPK